jgi:hypothetical protein
VKSSFQSSFQGRDQEEHIPTFEYLVLHNDDDDESFFKFKMNE